MIFTHTVFIHSIIHPASLPSRMTLRTFAWKIEENDNVGLGRKIANMYILHKLSALLGAKR